MEFITNILVNSLNYFELIWLGVFPDMTGLATVYAIIAVLSLISAAIGLVMVFTRRADGIVVKGGIIQALVVVVFPAIYSALTAA
jgi:hypothetical protein